MKGKIDMKKMILLSVLVLCGYQRCESSQGALVAQPETQAWPAPSFRGKPFWPLFAKMAHKSKGDGSKSSANGLEDLPLTQEYASCLNTHSYRAGAAKYRLSKQKDPESGKRIYAEPIPEGERLLGSYTLKQLFGPSFGEYLYTGDWTTRRMWNPQKGAPFILSVAESRPAFLLDGEDRGDKADFAAWEAAHPDFLGFYTMGEIDSDSSNYIKAMTYSAKHAKVKGEIRKDLESRFPVPKDRRYGFIDLVRRCWETEKRFHFGCDKFWPLYCNNHTLAHINASMGAVGLQNEISSSQGSPWTWSGAYTRGASRQWGIPFTWYCATFSRSFRRNAGPKDKPVPGDNKWPRNGKFTKKRPAYMGASLSLTARQKYYGWLIGAAMIQDEPWTMLCSSATNGIPCPSPYAKVFNDVFVRSQKIDRGAPLTPVALLTPITECVGRGGYVSAAKGPDGLPRDALNLPAYFFTLQPVHETSGKFPMLQERRRQGDEGCLFNSKFGEIWDVLVADAGQPTEKFASALGHYPAAFLIGTYRVKELDVAALEKYVRDGGTLFLSADYIVEGIVPATLAGVSFGEGRVKSGEALVDETGKRVEKLSSAYLLYAGEVTKGTRVLLKDEKGAAVAYVKQLGKGRVITTACHRSMPDVFRTTKYKKGVDDKTYLELRRSVISDEAELGLIRYLLDRVQRETIPVSVAGDIQWGLNKTEKGYLLWLINNKGIAKYVGEPADVDLSKTATVTVGLERLAGSVPFDADSGERLQVKDGAFTVSVPPGDVRFVRIALQGGK